MRVLIIDDEENIRKTTMLALGAMGHEAVGAEDQATALKQLEADTFDIAFLDLKLNGESGLNLLPELLKLEPQLQVVVITAYASIETAVEAMRRGAADYIPKPFTPEQIRQVIRRITEDRKLRQKLAELESRLSANSPAMDLNSNEPQMQKLFEMGAKAAATPATILGESGTGKTVLARAIHANSQQRENAFVTVNCPTLSRELLESELFGHVKGAFTGAVGDTTGKVALAHGGTLFLDEIGELPLEVQPKLLRLLQEKEYERVGEAKTRRANVRIISATNRDLERAVEDGRFREDLFYRLNVISLQMPPLRERLGDLDSIASTYMRFFADQCGKRIKGFSNAAARALRGYSWPGNLRELRNVIERAVILASGSEIEMADLPEKLSQPMPGNGETNLQVGARISLQELENEHIARITEQSATVEEAARILGVDPATLYRKRKKLSR